MVPSSKASGESLADTQTALGRLFGALHAAGLQQNQEPFAAEVQNGFIGAGALQEDECQTAQWLIAYGVAADIVDALELVRVGQQQCQAGPVMTRNRVSAQELFLEAITQWQAGERILAGTVRKNLRLALGQGCDQRRL